MVNFSDYRQKRMLFESFQLNIRTQKKQKVFRRDLCFFEKIICVFRIITVVKNILYPAVGTACKSRKPIQPGQKKTVE